jgi:hypothetical protein
MKTMMPLMGVEPNIIFQIRFLAVHALSVICPLALVLLSFPASANDDNFKVIRVANCRVLVLGRVNAVTGDVVDALRKGKTSDRDETIGKVRIDSLLQNRTIGTVLEPRSACRRFLGAFLIAGRRPTEAVSSRVQLRKGPPPLIRGFVAAGPSIVSSTLKGNAREPVTETYPLMLNALQVSAEIYPFMFTMPQLSENSLSIPTPGWETMIGIEGSFRYTTSMSDVRVASPSTKSGREVTLDLGINRLNARGGLVARIPVWKNRLFANGHAGYYFHRLASSIKKVNSLPDEEENPFALSPLRDLALAGFYSALGAQFQPVERFRGRLTFGTVWAPNYQIESRPTSSKKDAPQVNIAVNQPKIFLMDIGLSYALSAIQFGVDVSLESSAGRAFFPDGQTEGAVGEIYTSYGLSAAFLL